MGLHHRPEHLRRFHPAAPGGPAHRRQIHGTALQQPHARREHHPQTAAHADRTLPPGHAAALPTTDRHAFLRRVLLRRDRHEARTPAGHRQDPDPPRPGADVPPDRRR